MFEVVLFSNRKSVYQIVSLLSESIKRKIYKVFVSLAARLSSESNVENLATSELIEDLSCG